MGRDKATLLIDGETMAERVARALAEAGAASVICVGPAVGALPSVQEDEPGSGPLGAIVAALRWAGDRPVVVAPCDLITPHGDVFASLATLLAEGVDAAVAVAGGRRIPVLAAYSPQSLTSLTDAFAAGERSPTAVLTRLRVVDAIALDPKGVADADLPGDLPQ